MSTPPPDRDAELLRQFLAGRDVKCTACGFNLRDFDSVTCPKCSARLGLSVRPSHIRPFAWTAALISYSIMLLACTPLIMSDAWSWFQGSSTTLGWSQFATWSLGAVSIAMLALLLLKPYLFYRLPLILRGLIAFFPLGLVLGFVLFSL